MRPKLTSRGGRIAIAVVVVGTLAIIFRYQVLAFLIEPIGWLLWAGWRLLASVDQSICWVVIVLISAVMLLRLLPPRTGVPEGSVPQRESQWGRAGRLEHWEGLSMRAGQSAEGRAAFLSSLGALAEAVGESTKRSGRARPAAARTGGHRLSLMRLLPGYRRWAELRAIEDELSWMESALEIKHEG